MKRFIKTGVRRLGVAAFWGVVLLVLPNCTNDYDSLRVGGGDGGTDPVANLNKGAEPRSDVIFCDIEIARRCATDEDLEDGIPLNAAAIALNTGLSKGIGLDYSPEAMAQCTDGRPQAVEYEGPFPEGLPVCLNCGDVIGTPEYPDVNKACVAQCYDLHGALAEDGTVIPDNPPTAATKAICDPSESMGVVIQPAKASTNMPLDTCFPNACPDAGGDLNDPFDDPRRTPDPVQWQDTIGTTPGPDGTLTRTAPNPMGGFDAGAVSTQWFTRGDGYVEFGAVAAQQPVIGLNPLPANCPPPCTDTSQDWTTIGYAFVLGLGRIFIAHSGVYVPGPEPDGAFDSYTDTDRLRVSWTQNLDGTATVKFGKVLQPPCTPNMSCPVTPLYTAVMQPASYPLRVDTAFQAQGTTVTEVRVVYIK